MTEILPVRKYNKVEWEMKLISHTERELTLNKKWIHHQYGHSLALGPRTSHLQVNPQIMADWALASHHVSFTSYTCPTALTLTTIWIPEYLRKMTNSWLINTISQGHLCMIRFLHNRIDILSWRQAFAWHQARLSQVWENVKLLVFIYTWSVLENICLYNII